MEENKKNRIEIETLVEAPVSLVWETWTQPRHVIRWNAASPDWCTTSAENDLRVGGTFQSRMEARDGSMGFDFTGRYIQIIPETLIEYILEDGRNVRIEFEDREGTTHIKESFEPEQINAEDLQRAGWQSILDSFKRYAQKIKGSDLLLFECDIHADHTKVFRALHDPELFRKWTVSFNSESRYEGKWEKGSLVRFLGEGSDGKTSGMISRIREHIPSKFISIEHIGMIDGDREIMEGPAVDPWKGALENYTLHNHDQTTRLTVDIDSADEESANYFKKVWPEALKQLKILCEEK